MFTVSSKSTTNDIMRSDKSKDSEDISSGETFLKSLGLDDMKAVWTAKSNGVSVINFAYHQDGVIVYSDLIKIKVENGTVTGMESFDYYLNHAVKQYAVTLPSTSPTLFKPLIPRFLNTSSRLFIACSSLISLPSSPFKSALFLPSENGPS